MITTGRLVSVLLTGLALGLGALAWLHGGKPETGAGTDAARTLPAPRSVASAPPPTVAPEPAPTAVAPAATVRPSFDLIRVEKNGDAVIAGLSGPEWRVELLSNGEVLGHAVANGEGEWVIIPDRPLAKQDHMLTIRAISPDGKAESTSEQSVVIGAIGEAGQPIVLLDAPEKAGAVIQAPPMLLALAPETEAQPVRTPPPTARPVASLPSHPPATADPAIGRTRIPADANPAVRASEEPPDQPAPDEPPPTVADPVARSFEEPTIPPSPDLSPPAVADTVPLENPPAPETPPSPPSRSVIADVEPSVPPALTPPSSRPQPKLLVPALPSDAPAEAAEAPPAVAPAGPPELAAASKQVIPEVLAIETVEYEDDGKLTITGRAGAGATLRAYLNGTHLSDVPADDNHAFTFAFDALLATGNYRIRVDSVEPATGRVIGRVEVPFERDPELDSATGAATVKLGSARIFGGVTAGREIRTTAEPKVVVTRKGDNLWKISRKTYGKGRRYTIIYRANRDQIRDPDRIYPKQIFVLPQVP